MFIVHVHIHVKPEMIEPFKAACVANAQASLGEPGVVRFDVLQQQDDPARFLLLEVYRTPDDPARHKQTAHYAAWAESVASMMAEPRFSLRYSAIHPGEEGW